MEIDIRNVFDPLSTIVKLAIMSYKNIGCKLSVKNNIIVIQNSGIKQTLIRNYSGDNRNDLQYLSIPIELACKKYLTKQYSDTMPKIIQLFILCQKGIHKLMQTYDDKHIVIQSLKYYHSIIDIYMQNIDKINTLSRSQSSPSLSFKTLSRCSSTVSLNSQISRDNKTKPKYASMTNSSFNRQISSDNKQIFRYGATGYFILDMNISIDNSKDITENDIEDFSDDDDDVILPPKTVLELNYLKYYKNTVSKKFDTIWSIEKINIIVDMLNFFNNDTVDSELSICIDSFMNIIDKKILNIIKVL
jgi:hypothetical protein